MNSSAPSDHADILIVGGGLAGGIAAKHLAEEGFSVVCLEQGDWPSGFAGDTPEYELVAGKQRHVCPNVRQSPADYPVEISESDFDLCMYNGVGGTSVIYGGCWNRLHPSDFRVRTLDGVADDWPLTYEELLPFYEETDREMSVSGLAGDPAYPPGSPVPLPAFPINKTGRKAAEGLNQLGWHWWPAPVSIASRPDGNLAQCGRLGICSHGCPEGAKATTDLTHWPLAMKHGARVVTGARVREIPVDGRGLATGAVYIDRDGREHLQTADVVVLTASGIGTPRIMLMSESARFPNGLANSSGLVGRRLMVHPYVSVVGVYDDFLQDDLGTAGQQIQCMEFYETEKSRGFVRGSKWLIEGTGGPLGMTYRYANGRPGEELWGAGFHERVTESLGHMIEWIVIGEDLPEEHNRVTLDPNLTDSDGLPAPKIHYRQSENTKKLMAFNIERALEAHKAAGATKAWLVDGAPAGHLLGTARMGTDPETSVVDPYGRSHDVANLYVADSSMFVTASAVNPASTIAALARRTAKSIAQNARTQAVAA
ncbi:MAG: hypothetical protein JWQ20_1830 [Conexibacter sp.]|nr:hypothetical protein [Conexibacter sp.]